MRWKIPLTLAVVACAAASFSSPVEALPSNEVYVYYFSDAQLNDQVGEKWVTSCYGVVNQMDGTTGPYSIQVSYPCGGNQAPPPKCTNHGKIVSCNAFCSLVPEFCP